MLRYLPNTLTFLRLLLALPLALLILERDYALALTVGLVAGLTDTLDGMVARRLQALSRFGALLDPVADKVLITVSFICLAGVGLLPWWLTALVICRDLVIVGGALVYRLLYGPFEFAATALSKANMFVQVCFCLSLLLGQVLGGPPDWLLPIGSAIVATLAVSSGLDYVVRWSQKAVRARVRGQR